MKHQARADKHTFWNDLRIQNGYMYKDIADTLGVKESNVAKWFSGANLPDDKMIKDICDLFGVDFNLGKSEFINSKKNWKPRLYARSKPEVKTEKVQKKQSTTSVQLGITEFLKSIYGVVSWQAFLILYYAVIGEPITPDPRKDLYGQVSYDDFTRICEFLDKAGI